MQRLDGRCSRRVGSQLRGRGGNVQKPRLNNRPSRARHAHLAQAHATLRAGLSENGMHYMHY